MTGDDCAPLAAHAQQYGVALTDIDGRGVPRHCSLGNVALLLWQQDVTRSLRLRDQIAGGELGASCRAEHVRAFE